MAVSRAKNRPVGWLLRLGIVALIALVASLMFLTPLVRLPQIRPPHPIAPRVKAAAPATAPAPLPAANLSSQVVQPEAPVVSQPRLAETQQRPIVAPSVAPQHLERPARCPRGATLAWCLRGSVMDADDELRDAYAAAARAGVSNGVLDEIGDDWRRLRRRTNDDPRSVIRGYAELTRDLRAETARVER